MGKLGEKFVALVRVSTAKQEKSGLGLLAGHDDINGYIKSSGAELVHVFEEVESGAHDDMIDRPTLLKALALCRRSRAVLLVPKVDRLVRSTSVHTDIKRSGVSFRAVDNPQANELTLDILVAVAANEARQVSDRTRKGLKAYKDSKKVSDVQMVKLIIVHGVDVPREAIAEATDKEGRARLVARFGHVVPPEAAAAVAGKLGAHLVGSGLTPAGRAKGRARANARSRRAALDMYADLLAEMKSWRAAGVTLKGIAAKLNDRGDLRADGVRWSAVQVMRTLDRAKAAGS